MALQQTSVTNSAFATKRFMTLSFSRLSKLYQATIGNEVNLWRTAAA
jgi:hypothetical protein